jgi:beta-alanine--pyruvate transaminase
MLAAIERHPDGVAGRRGHAFQKQLFDHGLHLKTTGDAAIIAPPLIAERAHIDSIVGILRTALAGA